jgi:hypothetical protein
MFAILDKAKPDTGNIWGLNLAAVMCPGSVQQTMLQYSLVTDATTVV